MCGTFYTAGAISDTFSSFTLNRVGIRVAHFWPEKPAVWFAQLVGQFTLANVTLDTTKLCYVISHLDNKYAAGLEDVTFRCSIPLHVYSQ